MNIPDDLKGKWFVLFSHPTDFTPVCTMEFVAFQKRFKQFEELGCKPIGMSIDQVFSHIKWVHWISGLFSLPRRTKREANGRETII